MQHQTMFRYCPLSQLPDMSTLLNLNLRNLNQRMALQKQHPVCGYLSNYDYSRPGHREGIIERAELRHRPLLSCVARSIKISTWVSVGAGLSLHRHQANFSRVFDIYFARYY